MDMNDIKTKPIPTSKSGDAKSLPPNKMSTLLKALKASITDDDYFDTKSNASIPVPRSPSSPRTDKKLVRLHDQGCRSGGMEVSQVHPLLSELGFSAEEVNALLRSELLQERSRGRGEGSLADWKHYYTSSGPISITTTNQIDFPLARIAGGTAVNTRTAATIKLRKCRIKIAIRRIPTATATVTPDTVPVLQLVYWRDKVPTTPGTVPVLWIPGTNPPASGTAMFDSLGGAATDQRILAIRNPITEEAYHIYHYEEHTLHMHEGYQMTTPATGYGNAAPQFWIFDHNIDFNDVQQNYPSYASSQSDINDPYLTIRISSYSATNSFVDQYTVVTDTEFYDEQL